MQTRRIGSLEVSAVGLGCNNFGGRLDQEGTTAVVNAALEEGITFFDTADIYGGLKSEEFLGKALRGRRDEVVIASKFGVPKGPGLTGGAKPAYVRACLEESLQRMDIEVIDLYQLHFPDKDTPISETIGVLSELVAEGKIKEFGCSNFTSSMLDDADAASKEQDSGTGFVSLQNYYNVLARDAEKEVLGKVKELGLGFLPYSPLENGILTGKYVLGQEAPEGTRISSMDEQRKKQLLEEGPLQKAAALGELAKSHGHDLLDLAISWLLDNPSIASVIAGATKPAQIKANVAAAQMVIDAPLRKAIDDITLG